MKITKEEKFTNIDFDEVGEWDEQRSPTADRLKLLAEGLSFLLHPIFIPSIIFGVIFYTSPAVTAPLAEGSRLRMLGLLMFSTLFIPLCWFAILRYFGGMPSLKMLDRKDRPMPFFSFSIFYAFLSYLFISRFPIYINISIILTGITIILFLVTIISLYWKISVHSAAIWGAVGFLAAFAILFQETTLLFVLTGMILLAGITMSARLYLQVHKPIEVWGGAVLGFIISFFVVVLFRIFL